MLHHSNHNHKSPLPPEFNPLIDIDIRNENHSFSVGTNSPPSQNKHTRLVHTRLLLLVAPNAFGTRSSTLYGNAMTGASILARKDTVDMSPHGNRKCKRVFRGRNERTSQYYRTTRVVVEGNTQVLRMGSSVHST